MGKTMGWLIINIYTIYRYISIWDDLCFSYLFWNIYYTMLYAIWLWLTVRHGKIHHAIFIGKTIYKSMGHLYHGELLVITRAYFINSQVIIHSNIMIIMGWSWFHHYYGMIWMIMVIIDDDNDNSDIPIIMGWMDVFSNGMIIEKSMDSMNGSSARRWGFNQAGRSAEVTLNEAWEMELSNRFVRRRKCWEFSLQFYWGSFLISKKGTLSYPNHPKSIYLSICLFACLSICLSIYLFACLSFYLSVYLSIYLSVYLY